MTKNTANKELMELLHATLAERMREKLEDTENPPSAAELNVIRQFLKDNNIDATPAPDNPLGKLANSLPFPDPDSVERESIN